MTYHDAFGHTPAFWKSLKVGDEVLGRDVTHAAKDTMCGWPLLNDLMTDEGQGWLVCRAGWEYEPWCGCEGAEDLFADEDDEE